MLTTTQIIARKRDGFEHTDAEIAHIVTSIVRGDWTDYQAAAWLMAVTIRGMTTRETLSLTMAMTHSGEVIPADSSNPRLDKHSTGGVGDKTSLIVLPILAAMGATVLKMSGRGLGFTGGTLDKLESIPGLRTHYSPAEALALSERSPLVIIGQGTTMVPADRILYALRDTTATAVSNPLVASSILAKKIACGASSLILDIKTGRASLIGSHDGARALAREMIAVAADAGIATRAVISDMDVPLGRAIGNALELNEAIQVLTNPKGADSRLLELSLTLAAHGAVVAKIASDVESARRIAERNLNDGSAARCLLNMIEAQGGDVNVVGRPKRLPVAPHVEVISSFNIGFVSDIDARTLGEIAMRLGAGRAKKDSVINPSVGIIIRRSVGDHVDAGAPLAELHAQELEPDYVDTVRDAFTVGKKKVDPKPVVMETIRGEI